MTFFFENYFQCVGMGITYKFILYVGLSIIKPMPIELMEMRILVSFCKDMDIYISKLQTRWYFVCNFNVFLTLRKHVA